ncbi:hypothetical protein L3Q82_014604 [Scortum barcoo]|uniref:Uncharacterized protein n=1 Tax=Scortum barcoo TaxID=214431 RepID=A0ACB8VXG1_9TELE|nr:hypothetical protein L3Q82_014604 [Scortum barcoo]
MCSCCTVIMSKHIETAITIGTGVAELLPTHRQCSVEIKNKSSNYILGNPCVFIDSGFCAEPLPPHVDPSSSGNAMFTKTAHTARGAVGVFTYDLLNKATKEFTERVAVMFSVPYDFNLYSNWYALGIFDKSKECNYDLYYEMYNNTDNTFIRGKANGPSLSHKKGQVTIMASMSDSYQPVMKVEVKDN